MKDFHQAMVTICLGYLTLQPNLKVLYPLQYVLHQNTQIALLEHSDFNSMKNRRKNNKEMPGTHTGEITDSTHSRPPCQLQNSKHFNTPSTHSPSQLSFSISFLHKSDLNLAITPEKKE